MSKTKTQDRKQHRRKRIKEPEKPMLFSATNYYYMMIGLFMVIAGFFAMYLENQEKGFISLYISPIVIIAGFSVIVAAILKTDKEQIRAESSDTDK
ncbi:MAG: hypothetical protein WD491_08190 [Balneolales bacterium]